MAEKLADMNNLRTALESERGLYVTRDMLDTRIDSTVAARQQAVKSLDAQLENISSRLDAVERAKANLEGRFWVLGAGVPVLVIVVNWLVGHFGK
jgi:predicted RNase H-like nuclease (RuvC/YqgF family)